jgi:hypothetical protein
MSREDLPPAAPAQVPKVPIPPTVTAPAPAAGKSSAFVRFGVPALLGAVIGIVLWSLVAPRVIGWWYEPPVKDALSCAPSVRRAIGDFLVAEMIIAGLGGLTMLILVTVIRSRAARSS